MALDPLARPQSVHALVKEMDSDVARHAGDTVQTQTLKERFDSVLGDAPATETRKSSGLSRMLSGSRS